MRPRRASAIKADTRADFLRNHLVAIAPKSVGARRARTDPGGVRRGAGRRQARDGRGQDRAGRALCAAIADQARIVGDGRAEAGDDRQRARGAGIRGARRGDARHRLRHRRRFRPRVKIVARFPDASHAPDRLPAGADGGLEKPRRPRNSSRSCARRRRPNCSRRRGSRRSNRPLLFTLAATAAYRTGSGNCWPVRMANSLSGSRGGPPRSVSLVAHDRMARSSAPASR